MTKEGLASVSAADLRRALAMLRTASDELGPGTPMRQIMALILVALADRQEESIGVTDIDRELGDLKSGSASKLLRSMMHVETDRKPGVANTIATERSPTDLRRWELRLTDKGADALADIIGAMKGGQR